MLAYGWGWPVDADRPHQLARQEAVDERDAGSRAASGCILRPDVRALALPIFLTWKRSPLRNK